MQMFSGSECSFLQSNVKDLLLALGIISKFFKLSERVFKEKEAIKKRREWPHSIRSPQASILILHFLAISKMAENSRAVAELFIEWCIYL